ncbi:MAG: hypothetical protein AAGL10_05605 [Pseudomonadota bacterium]
MSGANELLTGPKPGERHTTFLDDPMQDHLLRAVITLAQELSVARERNRSLEQILVSKGFLSSQELDNYKPDVADNQARAAQRNTLVAKLLDPIMGAAATQK